MGKHKNPIKKDKKIHISKTRSLKLISPLHFNFQHKFYYEIRKYSFFIRFVDDQNDYKPLNNEIKLLEDYIFNNRKYIHSNEENNNIISILPTFAKAISNLKKLPKLINPIHQNIKEIFEENRKNNCKNSISKIREIYAKKYDKILSIKTIHRIMRNKLLLNFKKSILKPKKLDNLIYKKMSFLFIKCIIRAINLNFRLIFIDESYFKIKNNNFRFWQDKNDPCHYGNENNNKSNFLLAIGIDEIIHYKFTSQNTNSNLFIDFFKEIIQKISNNDLKKVIFIMDNLTSHCTDNFKKLIIKNSLKVIYTVPYESSYNPIELAFRSIKLFTYKNIYNNMTQLINDVKIIITSNKFKKTLFKNFLETLEKYIIFIRKNKNLDLNI